jgi:hypothetical protein
VSVRSELQQLAVREFLLWNKTWIAISWIRPSALSINFALPFFYQKELQLSHRSIAHPAIFWRNFV